MIAAHLQHLTLSIIEHIPQHEVRADDPHYRYFNAARRRMERQGLLKCWIGNGDCAGQIECHHTLAEFCLLNAIDKEKFVAAWPDLFWEFHDAVTDDEFQQIVEGEGNLTPLCRIHHTGILGVHVLPAPLWQPQKYLKSGLRSAELVPHETAQRSADGVLQ